MTLTRRVLLALLLAGPSGFAAEEREKPKEKTPGKEKPEEPKVKEGEAKGEVVGKGETWVEIRSEGEVRKYTPRWIGGMPKDGGGLEKDMLRAIRGLEKGQAIRFRWMYEERYRITEILK
jgi:hypothetical protein